MKFTALRMKNFMRFKGENTLKFSTDPEYNVTVVLGDNTVGKTTLAQAFRWVLYGFVSTTQYDKNEKNICILNNEVLGDMTANDHEEVSVELDLQTETEKGEVTKYRIKRTATFIRKFPKLVAVEQSEKLKMWVEDPSTGQTLPYDNEGKDAGKVDDLISELLPRDLSSYFLFDGEKWSDPGNTQKDIKDSVYSLVGVTPLRNMKYHLNEYGPLGKYGVVKQFKSKMSGTGDSYEQLKRDQSRYEEQIQKCEKNIKDFNDNADAFEQKANDIKAILDSNPNAEQDQKDYERLQRSIHVHEKMREKYYSDLVTEFSSKANEYFAAPLLDSVIEMIKDVDLDGSDVPDVTDKTIYWILKNHKCICGRDVEKDSEEEDELRQLLKVVPPALIGTYVGNFKDKVNKWNAESADMYSRVTGKANDWASENNDYLSDQEDLEKLKNIIDMKFNFKTERRKMENYLNQARDQRQQAHFAEIDIENLKRKLHDIETRKADIEKQNRLNQQTLIYVAYAEELYSMTKRIYNMKVSSLLNDLNALIEKNFREMFNEQEKYAKLDDDYTLRLYYKKIVAGNETYSNMEATGLSEGEKIARNFAFIVSILELAKNMKAKEKEEGEEDVDTQSMPLVLDGPFSKLSTLNTSKVATVMPKAAEQVIIFLLDKDWKASGLQKYTKPEYMYRIEKDVNENSSVLMHEEESHVSNT